MKSKSPDLTELQCCVIYERGYQGSCIDKTQKLTWGKKRRRTELTNVKRNLNDVQLKFWWGRAQKIKRARFSVTKQKRAPCGLCVFAPASFTRPGCKLPHFEYVIVHQPLDICGPQEHHACLCAGVAGIAAGQACMSSARNAYFSLHYVQLRSCTYIKKLSAAFSVPECAYQSHVIWW